MINFWSTPRFRFPLGRNYFILNGLSVTGKIDVQNKRGPCYILCISKITTCFRPNNILLYSTHRCMYLVGRLFWYYLRGGDNWSVLTPPLRVWISDVINRHDCSLQCVFNYFGLSQTTVFSFLVHEDRLTFDT